MSVDPTLDVEAALFESGETLIIGMDEVGRGAVAGPVVVGVCAISVATTFPAGLRDSKLMTPRRRDAIEPEIRNWGVCAVGEASAQEICDANIVRALGLAGHRALTSLFEAGVAVGGATVILDGAHDWLTPVLSSPLKVHTRVKADQDCAVVAAASVVAKVWRDALMARLAVEHPRYGWSSNKGYGAAAHLQAIAENGPTAWHRVTWLHG